MEEYSKYPVEVISGIAEETGMGMVCFLNPDTLETESVPGASYGSYECGDFDKYYQEVYRKVERWEKRVRIDPPEPGESFGIMERFIRDCIPDDAGIKERLRKAVSGRKPFRNFKYVIDGSEYRQKYQIFQTEMQDKEQRWYLMKSQIQMLNRYSYLVDMPPNLKRNHFMG